MLADASTQSKDAAWHYLHAAWALDDAHQDDLARLWRSKAADRFLALITAGQRFFDQTGASEAITSDCLRRSGRGTEALPLIEQALHQGCVDIIHSVLEFERALIQRGDISHHLIKEVLETRSHAADAP
jgi:hypothetical protein